MAGWLVSGQCWISGSSCAQYCKRGTTGLARLCPPHTLARRNKHLTTDCVLCRPERTSRIVSFATRRCRTAASPGHQQHAREREVSCQLQAIGNGFGNTIELHNRVGFLAPGSASQSRRSCSKCSLHACCIEGDIPWVIAREWVAVCI